MKNKLSNMLLFATSKHDGQFDKGGNPYILHPINVMIIVRSKIQDEEMDCIALGHDLLEDTNTTIEELIEIGMTDRIINAIKALTKMPGQSKKEYYKAIIENGKDAIIVKMADLEHNSNLSRIKGIKEKDLERASYYMVMYKQLEEELNLLNRKIG